MKKIDVIAHFGSKAKVASALGLTKSAVTQWSETIPKLRAYEIEKLTKGKLKVEPKQNIRPKNKIK